jgi:hypothetical protein
MIILKVINEKEIARCLVGQDTIIIAADGTFRCVGKNFEQAYMHGFKTLKDQ